MKLTTIAVSHDKNLFQVYRIKVLSGLLRRYSGRVNASQMRWLDEPTGWATLATDVASSQVVILLVSNEMLSILDDVKDNAPSLYDALQERRRQNQVIPIHLTPSYSDDPSQTHFFGEHKWLPSEKKAVSDYEERGARDRIWYEIAMAIGDIFHRRLPKTEVGEPPVAPVSGGLHRQSPPVPSEPPRFPPEIPSSQRKPFTDEMSLLAAQQHYGLPTCDVFLVWNKGKDEQIAVCCRNQVSAAGLTVRTLEDMFPGSVNLRWIPEAVLSVRIVVFLVSADFLVELEAGTLVNQVCRALTREQWHTAYALQIRPVYAAPWWEAYTEEELTRRNLVDAIQRDVNGAFARLARELTHLPEKNEKEEKNGQ